VLTGVLANEGADISAHEILERAQRRAQDFGVLAAEYETLARSSTATVGRTAGSLRTRS
jgi:hypothetical protein